MKFITIFDPKTEINFVKYFKLAGALAILLSLSSIVGFALFGLNWGIDFSGGMEMQVKFQKEVPVSDIRQVLVDLGFDKNQVQQFGPSENNEMLIRVERVTMMQEKDITHFLQLLDQNFPNKNLQANKEQRLLFDEKSGNQAYIWLEEPSVEDKNDPVAIKNALEDQRLALMKLLNEKGGVELRKSKSSGDSEAHINDAVISDQPKDGLIKYTIHFGGISNKIQKMLAEKFGEVEIRRVDFVDSQVSRQLRTDGVLAIIYALIAIVIYITIRFDIFFSPGAIIALVHDLFVALLVFVVARIEFDTPSIAALLTIVGYSINNTVVIYDRIRETVPNNPKKPLSAEELKPYVNKAINDTMSRTINTTLTTLFASVAIWIFATGVIQRFSIVLSIGIAFGAFTSVFVAPALYLVVKKYFQPLDTGDHTKIVSGPTREERAKGVV